MRWGEGDVRFSRPVRWVVALLDDAVLPVAVAGVPSGRITYGHRFLAPAPIVLGEPENTCRASQRGAWCIADVDARREEILRRSGRPPEPARIPRL